MPFPVVPAISAASNIGSQLLNNSANKKINQQNIDFQWQMYETQRRHALEDWNMQNAYNSPEQVMQRYADAGLNKNLIYGGGTAGATASTPRAANPGSINLRPPQFELGSVLGEFVDVMKKQAEVDLLDKQIELTKNKSDVEFMKYSTEMEKGSLTHSQYLLNQQKLEYLDEYNPVALSTAKERNDLTHLEVKNYQDLVDLKKDLQNQQIKETAERILTQRQNRLESQSRIETNAVKRAVMDTEIDKNKKAIDYLKNMSDLREKDVRYYETKGTLDIISKAVSAAKSGR